MEIHSASRIRVLPELLINQIAAGEVVERPASIVKELVENSLDAGATRIEVRLVEGGLKQIQIIDNGCGMSREDLALCLTRHATSKISTLKDLEQVQTFGFRGEALASIAAVSRLEIRSRELGSDTGYRVHADFGLMAEEPKSIGVPVGTSITVDDLFERLPARQKFLRSAGTESSYCSKVVKEMAAANPACQFYLSFQGKKSSEFVASTLEARFRECFRPSFEPMTVHEENEEAVLYALLSPGSWISDRGELWVFVNRRPVRNRALLSAVRQAYAASVGPHHDPSGAVFLDMRPEWVDVNVHPQKTEVRCYRQESLYSWLVSSIKKAIGAERAARPIASQLPPEPQTLVPEPEMPQFKPSARPTFAPRSVPSSAAFEPSAPTLFADDPAPRPGVQILERPQKQELPVEALPLRYLGQVRASYLVCESPTGLVLIDQHALHEKVRTEALKRSYAAEKLAVQQLLVPKVLPLPEELLSVLEENLPTLNKLGFELEVFGAREAILRARPEVIPEAECAEVVGEVLRGIQTGTHSGESVLEQNLHLWIATMACHGAIKANHLLTPTEAQALLSRLDTLELGWTCPHGRPLAFELTFRQMNHHFERS